MIELSSTACVILGALRLCPMTGYDIKAFADLSTRHFWAISYGQIYPELKRLEEAGLVTSTDDSVGSRTRRMFSLAPAGAQALEAWLSNPAPATQEVRDELLLRLFFSEHLALDKRLALVDAIVARHRATAQTLQDHRPVAEALGPNLKLDVLDFGVDFHTWVADWFTRLRATIAARG